MSPLLGTHPESVLQLLHDRRGAGYSPDGRGPRKLALIVEGGGMRGVLSAGSLLAVDLMGFRSCFDEIYATSAGAVNAAYFISGQGLLGITVYFDSINNRRFINPLRIFKMVDVDFVYDGIVTHVKPLDEAAIRRSPTRFLLSVTDVISGHNVLVDVKSMPEPIPRMLKASSALPVLYNEVVPLGDRLYVDGGVSDAMPVKQAIAAGCTDILVLATKLSDHTSSPSLFHRAMIYARMGWRYPKVLRAHEASFATANDNRRLAVGAAQMPGVNIAAICPDPAALVVGKTTLDRSRLIAGSRAMARRTYQVFNGDTARLDRVFAALEAGGDTVKAGMTSQDSC